MLDEMTRWKASKNLIFLGGKIYSLSSTKWKMQFWVFIYNRYTYDKVYNVLKHFTGIFHQKFLRSVFCCCHLTEFFLFDLGYTDVIKGLVRIGLLSPNQHPALHSQVFSKYLDRSGWHKIKLGFSGRVGLREYL